MEDPVSIILNVKNCDCFLSSNVTNSPLPTYYLRKYKVITEKDKIWPQYFVLDVINNSGFAL